jgi:hypothetical protein
MLLLRKLPGIIVVVDMLVDDASSAHMCVDAYWMCICRYHEYALWRMGIALVIFGSVADMMALSFSAQSLIAPLASLTLVSVLASTTTIHSIVIFPIIYDMMI